MYPYTQTVNKTMNLKVGDDTGGKCVTKFGSCRVTQPSHSSNHNAYWNSWWPKIWLKKLFRRQSWTKLRCAATWCYSTCLSGCSARLHVLVTSQLSWCQLRLCRLEPTGLCSAHVETLSAWPPDHPIGCWWDNPRTCRWPGSTRGPGRLSRWSSGV